MLGPLPTVHRVVVTICALLAGVGLGAWLPKVLPVTMLASTGAGIGFGVGAIAVLLLLHDPGHHDGHPQRVRVRR
ncbi:MAG: hypothetical protein ACXVXC_17160 [Nocardioidaceae bacterium]